MIFSHCPATCGLTIFTWTLALSLAFLTSQLARPLCPFVQDENLKQSFLLAVMMLVKAISRREGAHSYEFSQTSQLLECLIVSA